MNKTIIIFLFIVGSVSPAFAGSTKAPIAKTGAEIIITSEDDSAQLCPEVNCAKHDEILMLPTNTRLNVIASDKQLFPMRYIIWYKVIYGGRQGWVSELNTDKAPESPRYR